MSDPFDTVGGGMNTAIDTVENANQTVTDAEGTAANEMGKIPGFNKARIISLELPPVIIECHFNPSQYTVTKQGSWNTTGALFDQYSNVPKYQYGGGSSISMQMELYFDTTEKGSDVRLFYTNRLLGMMEHNFSLLGLLNLSKMNHPPKVKFQWGLTMSFTAVISNCSITYTMFLPDGTPTRAKANVTFLQVKDDALFPLQNPTSGGDMRRSHYVTEGDRLDLIAHRVYDDSSKWKLIAEANNIENPLKLRPGMRLLLPEQE